MKTLADSLRRQNDMLRGEIEEMALAIDQLASVVNIQNTRLREAGLAEVDHKPERLEAIDFGEKPDGENGDGS